jgi:hypothetical protein
MEKVSAFERDHLTQPASLLFFPRNTEAPQPDHPQKFTTEELVAALEPLGKVHDWRHKMPWHFRGSPANPRPFGEIIGERLREAREALGMDVATFYAPAAVRDKRDKPDKCPQMSRT